MHRAVHRLHGGVGKKWHLIDGVDSLRGARKRLFGVAFVPRYDTRLLRCFIELMNDVAAVDRGMGAIVPLDYCRDEPLLGCPHVIGDNGDCIIDPDHLAHTLTASAAVSFTDFGLPPNTSEIAIAAIFMFGTLTSIPNCARPLTLSGASKRLADVPMSVKSFGSFSITVSVVGTGSFAAASTSSP